jgi:arginine deiminase
MRDFSAWVGDGIAVEKMMLSLVLSEVNSMSGVMSITQLTASAYGDTRSLITQEWWGRSPERRAEYSYQNKTFPRMYIAVFN